jgi:predicted RNA binding protein YcfA (HicA-like mRNA interferase family)
VLLAIVHKLSCVGNAKKAAAKIADWARTNNVTLAEAETALKAAGFTLHPSGNGSHRGYHHPDGRKVTLTAHGSKLPSYIVRQIRVLLE